MAILYVHIDDFEIPERCVTRRKRKTNSLFCLGLVSRDVTKSKSLSEQEKNKMRHGLVVAYLDAGAEDKIEEIVQVSA